MNEHELTERECDRLLRQHRAWIETIVLGALFGIALGVLAALLMVRFDVANIGSLMANAQRPYLFLVLLAGGLSSVFSMVSMGIAIMVRADFISEDG